MGTSLRMLAAVSALGILPAGHAAQEQKPGNDRVRMEYGAMAKQCVQLSGDARTACLKDAQARKGAPAKMDIQKPDRMRPEPAKHDAGK